jgi:hypothetical protein
MSTACILEIFDFAEIGIFLHEDLKAHLPALAPRSEFCSDSRRADNKSRQHFDELRENKFRHKGVTEKFISISMPCRHKGLDQSING